MESFGRYQLVRLLARGGMGEVFLARRRGLGGIEKKVVIKKIRRERLADPRLVGQFVKEAEVSLVLSHQNIVPVFDFGRVGSELFLVMEYVDGVSLATALKKARALGRPLDAMACAYIGMSACAALSYAHSSGDGERVTVHRDITPGNVMLSFRGEVKLLDFGVAVTQTVTDNFSDNKKQICGTPGYMSPEQAEGSLVDQRSDIFGVGLCLWECLSNRPAFPQRTIHELLELCRTTPLPELDDAVPSALRKAISKATAFAAAQRFQTAAEFQAALDAYLVRARVEADTDGVTPEIKLVRWLEELFPERGELGREQAEKIDQPEQEVVTYLEDGLAAVDVSGNQPIIQVIDNINKNRGTLLSIAQTVSDSEEASGATGQPALQSAEQKSPTKKNSPWPLFAGGGAFVVLLGSWWMLSSDTTKSSPTHNSPLSQTALQPVLSLDQASSPLPKMDEGETLQATEAAQKSVSSDLSKAHASSTSLSAPTTEKPKEASEIGSAKARSVDGKLDSLPAESTNAHVQTSPQLFGTVRINASPWAKVSVIGRDEGCAETPCTLQLPPGLYHLRFENPVAQIGTEKQITVTTGQNVVVTVSLTKPLHDVP